LISKDRVQTLLANRLPDHGLVGRRGRTRAERERLGGPRVGEDRLRHGEVVGVVVRAAGAEHEGVDAHAHVPALGLDALPHEHAGALDAAKGAWLGADLKVLAALQLLYLRIALQAMGAAVEAAGHVVVLRGGGGGAGGGVGWGAQRQRLQIEAEGVGRCDQRRCCRGQTID